MSLDELAYLWDGSEPGWSLHRYDRVVWQISVPFANGSPSHSDILALRKLQTHFRNVPMSAVIAQLRGLSAYTLPEPLGNIAMRNFMDAAQTLGLSPTAEPVDLCGYLPVHSDGSSMIIDDNVIAAEIAERMIAAGVPVTEIHVD